MALSVNKGLLRGSVPSKISSVSSLNTKSFEDALSGNIALISPLLSFIHSNFQVSLVIFIFDEDMDKLLEPFLLSFIRKFTICRHNMDQVREFFHSLKLA